MEAVQASIAQTSEPQAIEEVADVQTPADEENVQLEARLNEEFYGKTSHKRHNAHLAHVPSDENDLLISTINDMNIWFRK